MRRKDKEITNQQEIIEIINSCKVFRLGLAKDNIPYIVPMAFGFDGESIYFHCAKEGRKIEMMRANNNVCFEFEKDIKLIPHDTQSHKWTFAFKTVIGYGAVQELTNKEDKINGLNHIMAQYSKKKWDHNDKLVEAVSVWKIRIKEMTGKRSG